ncbi:histidine phosphatase family protein [Butyrivibrio sp. YAB3001]|uniref:histidine phosphatase family protein n=1 Tax=Butyrivibrio sp. YAB3001 TaxID=1520812 RepID=UPI0008F63D4F|nr:histidine phosphatase family protein [Butyrivibrio sp. YAB3001]SFB71261.1 probable phosphoglycerate mutase [Butyrivibrio sp. YAB3001]
MRLIFIRHGEPDYANDCLTENGKKQAESTAVRLKDEDITAIYSSPMGRAKETASYTAKNHDIQVENLDFMHEINWGDKNKSADSANKLPYEGHPWTLAYRVLTDADECAENINWAEHPFFKDNTCMDFYEKISTGLDDLLQRYGLVRKNKLYECIEENADTIALFAHGGSGAIMFSHILNLPFPFVLTTMPYGVCSVSIINFDGRKGELVIPRLELFNDMGHLEQFKEEKLHFEK